MPNASLSKSKWGGMTAPAGDTRESMPGLKEYPVEQILYFHEMQLKHLKHAVEHLLGLDASANKENAGNTSVDIDMVKHLQTCSVALSEQSEKIQEQGKTIDFLRVELEEIKKQLGENIELVLEEE